MTRPDLDPRVQTTGEVGVLVRDAFHEFNNLAMFLQTSASVLRGELAEAGPNPAIDESLADLDVGLQRIVTINRRLRDLVTSRVQEPLVATPLLPLLDAAIDTATAGRAHTRAVDAGPEAAVPAVPARLHHALVGLVRGVLGFSSAPARPTLRVVRLPDTEDGLRLRFSSDGPGPTAHQRAELFQSVFKLPPGQAVDPHSLGLVRALVGEHMGELRLVDGPDGAWLELLLPTDLPAPL
jgi:signal transduction histidine kinase